LRRVAIGSCSYHDISMSPYTAKLFKCGHVALRADGVSGQGATCCGQVSGNRCHCCRLGGTAAALLPQPRRSCPLVVVPVDTDRSAGRPVDSGCPRPCRIAGQCPDPCRTTAICNGGAAADASTAVSGSRAGLTSGRTPTDDDGSGSADMRCGRCPPGVTSPLGSDGGGTCGGHPDGSAAAVRGGCPGFRTPADSLPHPAWPASGRARYRNRSLGWWPLVGCSQRRWARASRVVRRPRSWPRT